MRFHARRRRSTEPMRFRAVRVVLVAGLASALAACASTPPSVPSAADGTGPVAYFLGDSWTAGLGADPDRVYAHVASEQLGWQPVIDAISGTGYLTRSAPGFESFPVRAERIEDGEDIDFVVVQGSINDTAYDLAPLPQEARRVIAAVQERAPDATLVLLGPGPASLPMSPDLREIDRVLAAEAERAGVAYVPMLPWFTEDSIDEIIGATSYHPTTEGNEILGARLADALRAQGIA